MGEKKKWSGENASRSIIELPAIQDVFRQLIPDGFSGFLLDLLLTGLLDLRLHKRFLDFCQEMCIRDSFYPLSNWFLDLFSKEYDGLRRNQSPHCGFEYPIPATV